MVDMTEQVAPVTGGSGTSGRRSAIALGNRGVTVAAGYSRDKEAADRFCEAHRGSSVHQA